VREVLSKPLFPAREWDTYAFWHPALQRHLAARGLERAVFDEGTVELILRYLEPDQLNGTIFHLSQLLDEEKRARLAGRLLDFPNRIWLALLCAPFSDEGESDVGGQAYEAALDRLRAIVPEEVPGIELLGEHLLQLATDGKNTPDDFQIERLVQMLTFRVACTPYDHDFAAELASLLTSDQEAERMLGVYWYSILIRDDDVDLSGCEDLVREIVVLLQGGYARQHTTRLLAARALLDTVDRYDEMYFPIWNGTLSSGDLLTSVIGVIALQYLTDVAPERDITTEVIQDAERLLKAKRRDSDPRIRLAACGLHAEIDDPDPIVASYAARSRCMFHSMDIRGIAAVIRDLAIDQYNWTEKPDFAPGSFSAEFGALVAPLVHERPLDMLLLPFALFREIEPVAQRGNEDMFDPQQFGPPVDLLATLWNWYSRSGAFRTEVPSGPKVALQVWAVALAHSEDLTEDTETAAFVAECETALGMVTLDEEGRPRWQGNPLSADDIDYIESWTDHDLARPIAEAVLAGRFRAAE
jgi:hypothetical protein